MLNRISTASQGAGYETTFSVPTPIASRRVVPNNLPARTIIALKLGAGIYCPKIYTAISNLARKVIDVFLNALQRLRSYFGAATPSVPQESSSTQRPVNPLSNTTITPQVNPLQPPILPSSNGAIPANTVVNLNLLGRLSPSGVETSNAMLPQVNSIPPSNTTVLQDNNAASPNTRPSSSVSSTLLPLIPLRRTSEVSETEAEIKFHTLRRIFNRELQPNVSPEDLEIAINFAKSKILNPLSSEDDCGKAKNFFSALTLSGKDVDALKARQSFVELFASNNHRFVFEQCCDLIFRGQERLLSIPLEVAKNGVGSADIAIRTEAFDLYSRLLRRFPEQSIDAVLRAIVTESHRSHPCLFDLLRELADHDFSHLTATTQSLIQSRWVQDAAPLLQALTNLISCSTIYQSFRDEMAAIKTRLEEKLRAAGHPLPGVPTPIPSTVPPPAAMPASILPGSSVFSLNPNVPTSTTPQATLEESPMFGPFSAESLAIGRLTELLQRQSEPDLLKNDLQLAIYAARRMFFSNYGTDPIEGYMFFRFLIEKGKEDDVLKLEAPLAHLCTSRESRQLDANKLDNAFGLCGEIAKRNNPSPNLLNIPLNIAKIAVGSADQRYIRLAFDLYGTLLRYIPQHSIKPLLDDIEIELRKDVSSELGENHPCHEILTRVNELVDYDFSRLDSNKEAVKEQWMQGLPSLRRAIDRLSSPSYGLISEGQVIDKNQRLDRKLEEITVGNNLNAATDDFALDPGFLDQFRRTDGGMGWPI